MKEFSYTLESADLDNRIGVLLYRPVYPINSKTTRIELELSRYLCGAVKKNPEKYLNVKFTSSNQDMSFEKNPFRLSHFQPSETSDIPEHFTLELVNEAPPKQIIEKHLDGSEYVVYERRYFKPKYYKRYVICTNKILLSDLPSSVKIVEPRLQII